LAREKEGIDASRIKVILRSKERVKWFDLDELAKQEKF
jgi:hypothetical protein